MKVEKTSPPQQFKPISITFTIETEEELRALQTISRFNVSIPILLSNREHQIIIHDFLGMIQGEIIE